MRVTHEGREIDTSAREAADLARKRIDEVDAALEQFGTALNQLGGDLSLLDGHVRQDFDDELQAVNEDGDPIVDLGHFEPGATSSEPVAPRTGRASTLSSVELTVQTTCSRCRRRANRCD